MQLLLFRKILIITTPKNNSPKTQEYFCINKPLFPPTGYKPSGWYNFDLAFKKTIQLLITSLLLESLFSILCHYSILKTWDAFLFISELFSVILLCLDSFTTWYSWTRLKFSDATSLTKYKLKHFWNAKVLPSTLPPDNKNKPIKKAFWTNIHPGLISELLQYIYYKLIVMLENVGIICNSINQDSVLLVHQVIVWLT